MTTPAPDPESPAASPQESRWPAIHTWRAHAATRMESVRVSALGPAGRGMAPAGGGGGPGGGGGGGGPGAPPPPPPPPPRLRTRAGRHRSAALAGADGRPGRGPGGGGRASGLTPGDRARLVAGVRRGSTMIRRQDRGHEPRRSRGGPARGPSVHLNGQARHE
ncbi:hypothetical protein [Nocardia abscessus]|uniref:hypothetical protein n=1 Tax=Nocardia abscessus TaxID=120957 RepID=UPI0024568DE4|nr:hypothetical protein [Nocardia abscessus]